MNKTSKQLFLPGTVGVSTGTVKRGAGASGQHRSNNKRAALLPPEPQWKPPGQGRRAESVVRNKPQGPSPLQKKPSPWRQFTLAVKNLFPRTKSLYASVGELVDHYNRIAASKDAAPVAAQELLRRINARQQALKRICTYASHKDAGADVDRLRDMVQSLNVEHDMLEELKQGLLPAAQAQGVAVNLPLQELIQLSDLGVSQSALLDGMRFDLDAQTILTVVSDYERWGIPFNQKTFPGGFSDDQVVDGSEKRLGSGKVNTVHLLDYVQPDGRIVPMVFKPAATDVEPDAARGTGIPDKQPNFAGRNAATFAAARVIGRSATKLIPHTEVSVHKGQVGTVMAFVPGQITRVDSAKLTVSRPLAEWLAGQPEALGEYARSQGYASASVDAQTRQVTLTPYASTGQRWDTAILQQQDFADPVVRRDLTSLQWMDALMGQADRNPGNYVVQRDGNGRATALRGIDNDQCAGVRARVLTGQELRDELVREFRFYRGGVPTLPSVIDARLKAELLACDPQDMRAALSPYLSTEEVEARVQALERIHTLLGPDSPQPVRVINRLADWRTPQTAADLGMLDLTQVATQQQADAATLAGYVARDDMYQKSQGFARPLAREEADLKQQLASNQLTPDERKQASDRLKVLGTALKGEAVAPVFDRERIARDLAGLQAGPG